MGRGINQGVSQSALRGERWQEFLPRREEAKKYYDALREKHFSSRATGSRFTEETLEGLLSRMPNLDPDLPLREQDDRGIFSSLGITGLKEDVGYFRLPAKGVSRLVPASADMEVEIREAKPGFLSFVTSEQREVEEEYATVLLGNNPSPPPHWQVITTFPGLPYEAERSGIASDNDLGLRSGDKYFAAELSTLLGREDLLLQSD